MSLPVTRRIARAALLVAAGTAPVVGAAGSASALELPAKAPGLSNQDTSETANNAAEATVGATNELAKGTVTKIVPAAAGTLVPTLLELAPLTQGSAGTTGKVVKQAANQTAKQAAKPTLKKGVSAGKTAGAAKGLLGGANNANKGGGIMLGGLPLGG
ncbi:ATP-binding protein [Streptomyces sp. NPDC050636]|uniref:ATP-binding protein n=1 Tax=Streptomyces sp. NPDC050636 TaxID=3154510 RepID=UPI003449F644